MAYISTDLNRFYAALESSYGLVPAPVASSAYRALRANLTLVQDYLERQDKTGSRSFSGIIAGGRRHGGFEVDAYLIPSGAAGVAPNMGPFFQAACGGIPQVFGGGQVTAGCTTTSVLFAAPHGLAVGQAIGSGGELRFVTAVPSSTQVTVNPPFSQAPAAASDITPTVTYPLGASLPSLALFDYWDPPSAQQRILCGAAVDRLEVDVRGDFHQVKFTGQGQDVIDSITFASGQGGLTSFPLEPGSQALNGSPLAGHMGQIWLGSPAAKFATLSNAKLQLENTVELRGNEFGSHIPLAIVPGSRKVTLDFDVFEMDDAATSALYSAAKARTSLTAHLQLGSVTGSIFAACLNSLVPQIPTFDTGEHQLRWSFKGSRAGGVKDDELLVAFG